MSQRVILQNRDAALVRLLAEEFRILTREQIGELFPMGSVRRLNFRLKQLRTAGYLATQPVTGPNRTIETGYYLGYRAAELFDLSEKSAVEQIRKDTAQLSVSALPHRLLVSSIHIRFLSSARQTPEYRLLTWVDQYSPWWEEMRDYGIPVQADGYVEYLMYFGFQNLRTFFLEVDRGTERGHSIRSKLDRYVEFATSGRYQQQFAAGAFRVLFVTTTTNRLEALIRTMESRNIDLFWVTTWTEFKRARPKSGSNRTRA